MTITAVGPRMLKVSSQPLETENTPARDERAAVATSGSCKASGASRRPPLKRGGLGRFFGRQGWVQRAAQRGAAHCEAAGVYYGLLVGAVYLLGALPD